MTHPTAVCRVRLKEDNAENSTNTFRCLDDIHPVDSELQRSWTNEIFRLCVLQANGTQASTSIRDWDLVVFRDGRVENLASELDQASPIDDDRVYPAGYRVPDIKIDHLMNNVEKISRKELFAIGSILYEVNTSRKPSHDPKIQRDRTEEPEERDTRSQIAEWQVPDDVWQLPVGVAGLILCLWCPDFNEILQRRMTGSLASRVKRQVQQHPIRTSLQAIGAAICIASVAVNPLLGVVGFGASGPAAGSVAALWQSSIGLVEAGSFFSLCQSVAMGGAAASGVFAAGVSGGAVLASSTMLQLTQPNISPSELQDLFLEVWSAPNTEVS